MTLGGNWYLSTMYYFVRTPWWLRRLYRGLVWRAPTAEKVLYLSFDDGPHPVATPFVLDELGKYGAKGTFFCIGKNVETYPDIYRRILLEGHRVGNHTQDHLNGWKVDGMAICREYPCGSAADRLGSVQASLWADRCAAVIGVKVGSV